MVQEDVETTLVTFCTLGCAFVGHSIVLLTFAGIRCVLLRLPSTTDPCHNNINIITINITLYSNINGHDDNDNG